MPAYSESIGALTHYLTDHDGAILGFGWFEEEMKCEKRREKGRVRRSSLRAFGIWTKVVCDLCLQYFPEGFSGSSQLVLLLVMHNCTEQQGIEHFTKILERLLDSRKQLGLNGPLGGMTALRLKRPTCFGSYIQGP